eukprot:TRINITY_DN884_c0_g2_i2.p1 TRINITY_DN884_c0_g2~~TRINITY_DN884_c0_g2_i2.p1  ORF type:complete len:896 (-),score=366.43 TRINITY_DN884_c0_g2_i2:118-2688(-)
MAGAATMPEPLVSAMPPAPARAPVPEAVPPAVDPSPGTPPAAAAAAEAALAAEAANWECAKCGESNKASRTQCNNCAADRPPQSVREAADADAEAYPIFGEDLGQRDFSACLASINEHQKESIKAKERGDYKELMRLCHDSDETTTVDLRPHYPSAAPKDKIQINEIKAAALDAKLAADTEAANRKADLLKLEREFSEKVRSELEQADIAANEQARTEAEEIRKKENEAFVAFEADSTGAIGQMGEAITTLSEIGADQTMGSDAAHEQFMAGHPAGLLKLKSSVKQALLAASAFTSKKQVTVLESFIQQPSFTGAYSSQSGEVVGILRDMKKTFENNLETAVATEKAAVEAHTKFMEIKLEEHTQMTASYEEKQSLLSGHDTDLASATDEKATAEGLKAGDEDFLASLVDICAEKAKDYDKRLAMRANEEAALSQAIAILNSDAAFETFGKADATKTGGTGPASFFQRSAIKAHVQAAPKDNRRQRAQSLLRKASNRHQSMALSSVFAMLAANNPFAVVLEEIKKMITLIAKEEEADQKQFDWCQSERDTKNTDLEQKESDITALNEAITELDNTINSPTEGLKFMISQTEDALVTNRESQATETSTRKEAHAVYLQDVHHLSEAEALLDNAIKVLEKYYAKILKEEEAGLLQKTKNRREDPAPPETWTNGEYKGQSKEGGDAISMIKYILDNTKAEETTAHEDEHTSQKEFETSMTDLKTQEAEKEKSLAELHATLAEKEKDLFQKNEDLKATTADKESIEAYLEKIKPGCDFIDFNHETRKSNRAAETSALEQASTLLKESPAYMTFEAQQHNETLGDCLSKCHGAEETAECKACLAKVTVPAYCAGHPGTAGC